MTLIEGVLTKAPAAADFSRVSHGALSHVIRGRGCERTDLGVGGTARVEEEPIQGRAEAGLTLPRSRRMEHALRSTSAPGERHLAVGCRPPESHAPDDRPGASTMGPVWMPDGADGSRSRRSARHGVVVSRRQFDGSGSPEQLRSGSQRAQAPYSFSPMVPAADWRPDSGIHRLYTLQPGADPQGSRHCTERSGVNETTGNPAGRTGACIQSNESDCNEIDVRPFPNVTTAVTRSPSVAARARLGANRA